MSAPWLIIPLLIATFFIGSRFRKSVDDGELRGLREQKQAADDRLQLAHDRYGPVVSEVQALKTKIAEQAGEILSLKNHPAFQKHADEQLSKLINARLDKMFSNNASITTTLSSLSNSTSDLGTTLTIVGPKGKTSVERST